MEVPLFPYAHFQAFRVGTFIVLILYLFSHALLQESGGKAGRMKIKMRYENKYQTLEVETEEMGKWLNISILEDESQEEYEKRIQKEVDIKYNNPDYNSWHKHNRHSGDAKIRNKDGKVEVNTEEAIKEKSVDESVYTECIEEMEEHFDYEYHCEFLRENLKTKVADMVIAIAIDGMTVGEYAASIGDDANNVSHRYRRAINKLKKVFSKTSFYPFSQGYQVGG